MKNFGVKFAPEALEQLDSLEQYIAEAASSTVAAGYIDAIVS
jgi:toxin ParE1/3/4